MPRRSSNDKGAKAEEREGKCEICDMPHQIQHCPLNSGVHIPDSLPLPKAILTLPDLLNVKNVGPHRWEVTAKALVSEGVQFGPLDAPKSLKYNPKCGYLLWLFQSKPQPVILDTTDETKCNWMSLVPFSSNTEEVNCVCYQFEDSLYFTTTRDVTSGERLVVGYSPGYLTRLNEYKKNGNGMRGMLKGFGKQDSENEEKLESFTVSQGSQSADHDYYANTVEEILSPDHSATTDGTRRSNRKRKIVGDDDFIFETLSAAKSPFKKDTTGFTQILDTVSFDGITDSFMTDEDLVTAGELIAEEIFTSGEMDSDFQSGLSSEDTPKKDNKCRSKEEKNRAKGSRMGAVLALEQWTCKFCKKLELSIPDFAFHLIEHYKSVGAARTEKSRLEKLSWCDEFSQSVEEANTLVSAKEPGQVDSKHVGQDSCNTTLDSLDAGECEPKFPYVCDICVNKKIFNRGEYIIRHLKNHTGEVSCPSCSQMFAKESYLEHDCMYEEECEKSFACTECEKTFSNERRLHIHLELIHSKPIECNLCQKTFQKNDSYELHKCKRVKLLDLSKSEDADRDASSSISDLQQCDLCDLTFDQAADLTKHIKTHGNFTCPVCSKILASRNFKTHLSICQTLATFASGKADELKCPTCTSPFDTRDSFRYHVATHTHPAMCPVCNLRLPSTAFVKSHSCSKFQCDGCSESFVTLMCLKNHISNTHGQVEFYCFECALPFVTQDGYAGHYGCGINEFHIDKRKKTRKVDEGMFVCEVCGATYTKWSSLKTHRYTHGPKRFVCDLCGKSFHRKEMLMDHEFVHQDAQFECQICQKKVKSRKSLDVHMQIHKGNKRFQCDQCDKAFCQKINLITHKMVHLPPELKGFECHHCQKKFASKEYLGFHIEAHEKGRNQICEICGRSFVKLHMLKQHVKTAHGSHRYACEFCNIIVRQKHSLTRHLKKRHQELQEHWQVKGYMESRYISGDTRSLKISANSGSDSIDEEDAGVLHAEEQPWTKNVEIENDKDHETGNAEMQSIPAVTDGIESNCQLTFSKMELQLSDVVDVDDTGCEVETEEIAYATDSMLLSDTNMMILQVEEGGEIVLTLATADSLHCSPTMVESVLVDDVNGIQL